MTTNFTSIVLWMAGPIVLWIPCLVVFQIPLGDPGVSEVREDRFSLVGFTLWVLFGVTCVVLLLSKTHVHNAACSHRSKGEGGCKGRASPFGVIYFILQQFSAKRFTKNRFVASALGLEPSPLGCACFPEILTFLTWTRRNWEFRCHRKWSLNRKFQC